jgi:serine/threonine protein kinase
MRDSGWNHTERVYMRHCRRNMQQEYDLLCKFRGHGLIVQAFHVGYVRIQGYGELPALLMEHCAGGSLEAFVKDHVRHFGRGLSYEDARQVMIRANNALRALHLKGIGHGDLKMSNFLFTKAKKSPDAPPALADMGQLKLSDLGCAYVFQPGEPRRDSASTPSHRPPELSRQGASDFRAESWLMGCLLLELRSSRPPFPHLPVEDERRGPAELDNPEGPYHALLNDTEKHLLRALLADPVTRLTMSEIYNHPHYSGYFL